MLGHDIESAAITVAKNLGVSKEFYEDYAK
jgi:hypothetical protein